MFELVLLAAGFLVLVGALLGLAIGITAKVFAVHQDPKIEMVTEALPGANCGGCGFAGCSDFAKAIVEGKAEVSQCPVCTDESATEISGILGVEASDGAVKNVAVILCGGDKESAKSDAGYNGINDCKSAVSVASGLKGCKFGCLGLGTCAKACPFNAIEITENGLAVVHPDICVGCGKCVDACPKNLVKLVPETVKIHVFCSSPDKEPAKKKVCKVSCIGCRKCLKAAEKDQMLIKGFCAEVNYENAPPPELVEATGCPTKCLKRTDT